MSQHDYNIANQDGASFRADLNNVLAAVATLNSGPTEPAAMFAGMLWLDTTTGLLKQRNTANTAWATLADAMLAGKTINGTLAYTNQPTVGTAQAMTSGTSKDFTGIPSWVKRVSVMFANVSTNGISEFLLRLGAGSIQSTGYTSSAAIVSSGSATSSSTSGLLLNVSIAATESYSGIVTVTNMGGNNWASSGTLSRTNATGCAFSAGSVTLTGTLDRLRITTVGGTDAFDAGSVNILYE